MLATLLRPTSGSAVLAGFDTAAEPEKVRAHVGFLATSTALYARLTAREMIAYFGRLATYPPEAEIKARTKRLATDLDMHEFLDRRCDQFSTGMKQKTSIARTLIHDPQVMIFDEPTLGLDVMAARAIVRFVRECRGRGKTVIYFDARDERGREALRHDRHPFTAVGCWPRARSPSFASATAKPTWRNSLYKAVGGEDSK